MSKYQTILTNMKRKEVEAVAKEFNNTYKITGIGKKKKNDLITDLLQNEKLLDEVFNILYPKGEAIQDIVEKVKKPRKKTQISKDDEKDLIKQIKKMSKEAIQEKSPSGKLKILKEIRKLQQKLSKVEVKKESTPKPIKQKSKSIKQKSKKDRPDIKLVTFYDK